MWYNKSMEERPYHFQTTDIGEAAALITNGFPMTGIESAGSEKEGQMVFVFIQSKELALVSHMYYFHGMRVDPNAFYYCVKDLRQQLRQTGRRLAASQQ